MYIDKAKIVAALQSRGLQARAGWVERALPPLVDIHKNSALLRMLDIDPAAMSPVDVDPAAVSPVAVDPADVPHAAPEHHPSGPGVWAGPPRPAR